MIVDDHHPKRSHPSSSRRENVAPDPARMFGEAPHVSMGLDRSVSASLPLMGIVNRQMERRDRSLPRCRLQIEPSTEGRHSFSDTQQAEPI